jgi:hypothetical protein
MSSNYKNLFCALCNSNDTNNRKLNALGYAAKTGGAYLDIYTEKAQDRSVMSQFHQRKPEMSCLVHQYVHN